MEERLIYLEADEEITGVIDKISKALTNEAVLVIPRGGNIAQSLVNLKLIKKRAGDLGREVSLVTTDKISRNLASQVGISVYSRVEEIGRRKLAPVVVTPPSFNNQETIKSQVPMPEIKKPAEEIPEIPGVKINRYYDQKPQTESPKVAEIQKSIPEQETSNINQTSIDQSSEPKPAELENQIEQNEFSDRKISEPKIPEIEPTTQPEITSKDDLPEIKPREEVKHHPHKHQPPGRRFKPMRRRKALVFFVVLAVVIIFALGYLILPQAKAEIIFQAESYQDNFSVTAKSGIDKVDGENLVIPASSNVVSKELTKEVPASGKKNIGNKAGGKVTLYNAWSSDAVKITAGTILTANGKNFTTKAEATIPGGGISAGKPVPGQTTVDIEAADAGDSYNLAANSHFTISSIPADRQASIYGSNPAALTGGSTQEVLIILQSDIDSANAQVKDELSKSAKEEVLKKIPSNEKFIEGSIKEEFSNLAPSSPAGTQADKFTFKGKINTTILSLNETNLIDALVAKVEKKIPGNRVLVQKDKSQLSYKVATLDPGLLSIVYSVDFQGKISSKIDGEALKSKLVGMKRENARNLLLSLELVKDVKITMTPNFNFYKTLPLFKRAIKIQTSYQVD